MPATWKMWSADVAGRVLPLTPVNEQYVALRKVQGWLDQGYSERQVALIWNQGSAGDCRRGVNKHGAEYDSCAYAQNVLVALNR